MLLGGLIYAGATLLTHFVTVPITHTVDAGSIGRRAGHMASYRLPFWFQLALPSDSIGHNEDSELVLSENSAPLRQPHSFHEAISRSGHGTYSHWGNWLLFSASDDSDPASNGRTYMVRGPLRLPTSPALVILGIAGLWAAKRCLRIRQIGATLLVIGISVCVTAGAMESFVRSDFSRKHVFGVFGPFAGDLAISLNSRGYRDAEHAIVKPEGVKRVLVLGDSFTFGWGVAAHDMFLARLREMAGPGVEFIALARNGWQTADELRAFQAEGAALKPDVVLVAVVTNDPGPATTQPSGQEPEWSVFRRIRLPFRSELATLLDYHLNRLADAFEWRYSYAQWERDIYDPQGGYYNPWRKAVSELGAAISVANAVPLAFIMTSPLGPNLPEQVRKYEILQQVFSDAGFRTTNLRESFIDAFGPDADKRLWALPNDAHPGPEVNAFYAREMWGVLEPVLNDVPGD